MRLDRRTFLQQAGLALFTLGATESGISTLDKNDRLAPLVKGYLQTLAEPTSRKLALLVGINRYPQNAHLHGCLTDIELQRELLINRFGFNSNDIITLSDRQATRENIETAFVEHLSEQVKADDVVVFHFSGYGGQIKMPLVIDGTTSKSLSNLDNSQLDTFELVNSLIPVDGLLPTKKNPATNSLLQDTLLLLAQSLPTNKCTVILDTSFHGTPQLRHGNLKIRSTAEIAEHPNPQELIFLEQLKATLGKKGLKPGKRLLSIPGVVLSAAGKNQVAAERRWNGFSAGLFTYALTQYLWQITPSSKIQIALQRAAETVEQVMGKQQQPAINSTEKPSIAYYLAASDSARAQGVVSTIAGKNSGTVGIKLVGLPATILDCYGVGSCLSLLSFEPLADSPQLQIKSREGLIAKVAILNQETEIADNLQIGRLVREVIRVFDRDLSLTLALDADLERIERVDATSALANIDAVSSAVISGEQNADCILGKVENDPVAEPEMDIPQTSQEQNSERASFRYGLFTAGGILISKTTGVDNEAVKIAIARLTPQFNNLLAAKWLELTNNEFSSALKVGATLKLVDQNDISDLRRTTLSSDVIEQPTKKLSFFTDSNTLNTSIPILIKGSQIRLSLANFSDRPLYAIVLGIDSDSNIFALYTPKKSGNAKLETQLTDIAIAPGTELVIPESEKFWQWKVSNLSGISALYTIFSVKPFDNTLATLAAQPNLKLDQEQVLNVPNPIAVIEAIMQDLHLASSVPTDIVQGTNVYALNVNNWATLNFIYDIANS
jgi:Caspase domain